MKRINIIFTAINIFIIAVMLIQIGIAYEGAKHNYISVGPFIVFTYALLYIPFLILANVIWRVIRRKKTEAAEAEEELPLEETPVSNVLTREEALRWLVNIIAVALNVLIIVLLLIHTAYEMSRIDTRMTFWGELFGSMWIYYIIPFTLVNDAWFVVRMNLKKAN